MNRFYEELDEKRKVTKICLQTDQEFLQNKINRLNKNCNIYMFQKNIIRSCKAFFAE